VQHAVKHRVACRTVVGSSVCCVHVLNYMLSSLSRFPCLLFCVCCCCLQVAELQEQLQQAQQSIAARDGEVSRLGARLGAGGPDVQALARDQRGDAYDTIVLSLNKQVRGLHVYAYVHMGVGAHVGARRGQKGVLELCTLRHVTSRAASMTPSSSASTSRWGPACV
jgi:hypothetical protein